MELYVPTAQLKQVSEVLAQEGVTFEVTGKNFSLAVEGKDAYEVNEVKAKLLETEVPPVLESASQTRASFPAALGQKNPAHGFRWQF